MSDVTELVAQLAAVMGTTASQLWDVMVSAQPVLAVADTVWAAFFVLVATVAARLSMYANKERESERDQFSRGNKAAAMFMVGGVALIAAFLATVSARGALLRWLAPEYMAAKTIIDAMAGGPS